MSSINNNQPEKNHEDLISDDAIVKVKTLIEKSKSCFFVTRPGTDSGSNGVRPMSVQYIDDAGNIWFLSATDSSQNREIAVDSDVTLYFQGSAHADFLYLRGKAVVTKDREKIHELWEPLLKTWFTEGENDPRISVIQFIPLKGYYWDNKHGNAMAAVKILFGAVLGKTLDDSMEGKLSRF